MLTTSSEERLKKMSASNRVGNKIDASKLEIGKNIVNKIAYIQDENIKNMTTREMKLSSTASIQYFSLYQTHTDLLKWLLLKTPEKSTHASQFTKHLTYLTLEGVTLLQLHKWWDTIRYAYFQSLPTNNLWTAY